MGISRGLRLVFSIKLSYRPSECTVYIKLKCFRWLCQLEKSRMKGAEGYGGVILLEGIKWTLCYPEIDFNLQEKNHDAYK